MVQELRGESILPAYILLLPSHFIIIIFFLLQLRVSQLYSNQVATYRKHRPVLEKNFGADPFWKKDLGQVLFGKGVH